MGFDVCLNQVKIQKSLGNVSKEENHLNVFYLGKFYRQKSKVCIHVLSIESSDL